MEIVFKESQIQKVAKKIIEQSSSKILCLYGAMGSGKTTLIKAFVKELGGGEVASSPTFGIVNEYHKSNGELLCYHFDFYRLKDDTEALDLGLEDYLSQDVWIFMEWPEKIRPFLPKESKAIYLEVLDTTTRKLAFGS